MQIVLNLSQFAMDVLHGTFHTTSLNRELSNFFHRRAENTKENSENLNVESSTLSWLGKLVSTYSCVHIRLLLIQM